MDSTDDQQFHFRFESAYRGPARLLGITPDSARVTVDDATFEARFGPWTVRTALSNVASTEVSGPYAVAKTIGPARLSFADRGLTFATNSERGVCIAFVEPVSGMDPFGMLRHPGLTVTVADPEALVAALAEPVARHEVVEEREEQAAEDELHTMTASELRDLADERGLQRVSSMKKADLVELLEADLGDDLVEEFGPDD